MTGSQREHCTFGGHPTMDTFLSDIAEELTDDSFPDIAETALQEEYCFILGVLVKTSVTMCSHEELPVTLLRNGQTSA
jgi:hypothetical protein